MTRRGLGVVIAVGVLAHLIATVAGPARLEPLEPSEIARHLNAGDGFVFEQYGATYRAWKEPLFPVGLAALQRVAGQSDTPIRLAQAFFGIATVVGVWWLGLRLLGDARRATLAGVLAALNPFLLYYDTRWVHPLSFDTVLFVLVVAAQLVAFRAATWRSRLLAGLALGLGLWERTTLWAIAIGLWCAGLVFGPSVRRRTTLISAAVSLSLGLAVFSPWLIRNARLFGRVIVTTDAAHILWLGNNPWSNGTYSTDAGKRVFYVADPAFQRSIVGQPELVQHDRFLAAAKQFIAEDPIRFIRLSLRRAWAFLCFSPNVGVQYTETQRVGYRVVYSVVLLLGFVGAGRWWRRATREQRQDGLLVAASLIALAAVHAVMAINLKHRVPFELILSLFAASGVIDAVSRRRPCTPAELAVPMPREERVA